MRKLQFLVAFLLITVSLFGEEFWYQSYEKALEAFKAGNCALAEQKLLESKSANPPKQGKRVKYYGTKFSHYYPDYYLALCYSKTGRNQEAAQMAQSVLASNIFSGSDSQLQELNNLSKPVGPVVEPPPVVAKVTAEEIAAVKNAIQKGNLEDAKKLMNAIREKDPSNPEMPKLTDEYAKMETKLKDDQARQEVQTLLASAETALNQKKYDEARKSLNSALQKDPSNQKAKDLIARLDRETTPVVDPNIAKVNDARRLFDQGRLSDARKILQPLKDQSPDAASLLGQITGKEKQYRDLATKATTFPDIQNAKSTIDGAAKKDPGNPMYADLLKNLGQKQTQIQNDFSTSLTQAETSLQANNYPEARRLAKIAAASKVDDVRSRTLLKKIDIEENAGKLDLAIKQKRKEESQRLFSILASIAPNDPRIGGWENKIKAIGGTPVIPPKGPSEWDIMLAFYQGKYEDSIRLFQEQNLKSAKAFFYLGCSQAAMALMNPKEKNQELLSKAQQQFAQVRKIDAAFQPDGKFISPRIIELYNQTR